MGSELLAVPLSALFCCFAIPVQVLGYSDSTKEGVQAASAGAWQWLLRQGADRKCFSLSPAASASHRAAQVENQAESQESLSYIPDAAINFLYGLGQLVSPASLGFSLDKVERTVKIVDLWSLKLYKEESGLASPYQKKTLISLSWA